MIIRGFNFKESDVDSWNKLSVFFDSMDESCNTVIKGSLVNIFDSEHKEEPVLVIDIFKLRWEYFKCKIMLSEVYPKHLKIVEYKEVFTRNGLLEALNCKMLNTIKTGFLNGKEDLFVMFDELGLKQEKLKEIVNRFYMADWSKIG